jgi:hypothetical protein
VPITTPVGPHEILDRRALAQEFRVGGDIEAGIRQGFAQDPVDPSTGADRNGRFGDDDRPLAGALPQRLGDLGRDGDDIAQIGMAVAAPRRRADRDEHGVGASDRGFEVGGEAEPPGRRIAGDQLVEARFVDRDFAARQALDLVGILVDAADIDAEFGKTRPETRPT